MTTNERRVVVKVDGYRLACIKKHQRVIWVERLDGADAMGCSRWVDVDWRAVGHVMDAMRSFSEALERSRLARARAKRNRK